MPKEHVVLHDEVPETIAANRREMKGLENAVVQLALWKRESRKKIEADAEKAATVARELDGGDGRSL